MAILTKEEYEANATRELALQLAVQNRAGEAWTNGGKRDVILGDAKAFVIFLETGK